MRQSGNSEQKLDVLFQKYREACAQPEPGANFMPEVWQRIEARRRGMWSLSRVAQAFVVASAAACILLGGLLITPLGNQLEPNTYVEVLAEDQSPDRLLFQDIALRESTGAEFQPARFEESR